MRADVEDLEGDLCVLPGRVSGGGPEGSRTPGSVEAPDNSLSPRRNGARKNSHGKKSACLPRLALSASLEAGTKPGGRV